MKRNIDIPSVTVTARLVNHRKDSQTGLTDRTDRSIIMLLPPRFSPQLEMINTQ